MVYRRKICTKRYEGVIVKSAWPAFLTISCICLTPFAVFFFVFLLFLRVSITFSAALQAHKQARNRLSAGPNEQQVFPKSKRNRSGEASKLGFQLRWSTKNGLWWPTKFHTQPFSVLDLLITEVFFHGSARSQLIV